MNENSLDDDCVDAAVAVLAALSFDGVVSYSTAHGSLATSVEWVEES